MAIRTVRSRLVYRSRWLALREDEIERPDGSPGTYAVIEKPDFVLIIPIEDDNLYLVEQYRFPVQARFLEFPQGSWELRPDANPVEVARGELQEETGLRASRLDHLGHLFIAYGMSNQGFDVFRATGLTPGARALEKEEQDLVVKRVRIAEFKQLVQAGEIKDAASISAWALLMMKEAEVS
jgi:8-oxo-dGTP pyrophosphatase MutT (NUDIX family)